MGLSEIVLVREDFIDVLDGKRKIKIEKNNLKLGWYFIIREDDTNKYVVAKVVNVIGNDIVFFELKLSMGARV